MWEPEIHFLEKIMGLVTYVSVRNEYERKRYSKLTYVEKLLKYTIWLTRKGIALVGILSKAKRTLSFLLEYTFSVLNLVFDQDNIK